MKCPRCKRGDIRVMAAIISSPGHPLICDQCLTFFCVDGGSDSRNFILPPKRPLRVDNALTNFFKTDNPKQKERFKKFPLLEDFKQASA